MLDKLAKIEERYEELNRFMVDPKIATDPARLKEYAQEQAEIAELVEKYREYKANEKKLAETRTLLDDGSQDEELEALVKEELASLQKEQERLMGELKFLLLPKDPRDDRNVIIEIRAGTGGEEAALFAADLYRMYVRYAENQGWKPRLINYNETGVGGFKEVIFEVKGEGAYSRLKYESGVHRVQRVPITEAGGRIHTSTATVAVLPEADEVEVEINPEDLRIDVFRSQGHGGQSVNTTDSAVRITHIPTGMVVTCQDERSQLQNKARAMAVLRARLYAMEEEKQAKERDTLRRSQVGTGERSEKIRTYNFPQNRVTDHRIGLTSYRLHEILEGELDEFVDELAATERAEKLRAAGMEVGG